MGVPKGLNKDYLKKIIALGLVAQTLIFGAGVIFFSTGFLLLALALVISEIAIITIILKHHKVLLSSLEDLLRSHQRELEQTRGQTKTETSHQIAHDIRSPLAALKTAYSLIQNLDDETRLLLRNSINRIEDMANQLSSQEQLEKKEKQSSSLIGLVKEVLSQQRLQNNSENSLEFKTNFNDNSYTFFVEVIPVQFKQILIKFLDEMKKSIHGTGVITVSVYEEGQTIHLSLQGLPFKLGSKHLEAIEKKLKQWQGSISILSPQKGFLDMALPRGPVPLWHSSHLEIPETADLVIIDDDPSLFDLWKKKLKTQCPQFKNHIHCFSHPDKFQDWYEGQAPGRAYVFLVDYELPELNGLKLIEKFQIEKTSTLVTSRYEEKAIQKKARELKLKILPKPLIPFSQISLLRAEQPDYILIDDDPLVHLTWKECGKSQNILVQEYHEVESFLSEAQGLSRRTPVYIDSRLKNNVRGEQASEKIFQLGFSDIYLATGYDKEDLTLPYWIKDVTSKGPPWIEQ